ncbi:MAG: hypothetical protein AB1646_07980 [Thermodesulfobacteriota bacterium]
MTRMRFERECRKWTRRHLAEHALISESTVVRLEQGKLAADRVRPIIRRSLENVFDQPLERPLQQAQLIEPQ